MTYVPKILKEQSQYLQKLIDEGKLLAYKLRQTESPTEQSTGETVSFGYQTPHQTVSFDYYAWHQSVLNTFSPLLCEKQQEEDILADIKKCLPTSQNVDMISGRMRGMFLDIERGKLNNLFYVIQKEDIEDLLGQADEFLVD